MKGAERIETARLVLRKPGADDAEAIFSRYAADPEVTRFVGWPMHRSIEDTHAFLDFSAAEWERWGAGPYLIERREDGFLLGSTGLAFETTLRAATGYVLAKDSWGLGYATEALGSMAERAGDLGVRRLYALCHTEHLASRHVLEKCGFQREGVLRRYAEFPNLDPGVPLDVFCYARLFA